MGEDISANGQSWIYDALPPETYDDAVLSPDQQRILASDGSFTVEQIDQSRFTGPFRFNTQAYDVAIPGAVVGAANGKTWLVVQVTPKHDFGPDAGVGTYRQTEQGRERVSASEFFLVDPSALDESGLVRLGAGSASVLDTHSGHVIKAGSEVVEPPREDEEPVRGLKVIVTRSGEVLISNRGESDVRLVTPRLESAQAMGEQTLTDESSAAADVAALPEDVPEVHRPSAAEIFTSAETFADALADEQLDPELRNQLHDLQSAWREVHVALEGNELWDSRVRGALTEAADVLTVMKRQGNDIQGAITELRGNLSSLADAFGAWYQSMGSMDRRIMDAAADRAISILRNANISGVFDHVKTEGRKLSEQGLDVVVSKLNWEAIEADERYRDMRRYDGSMAAWPTEQMVQQVGSMLREGASLQTLTDEFSRQGWDLSSTWSRRRDALELLARLNHRAQSAAWIEADSAYNTWQEIDANRRRGSLPSPDQLENVRLRLHLPLEEVELFNSLARLAEAETEDTRARA